mgnify:CR=1 FL=1
MNYEKFIDKIKEFEKFKARAYICPAGVVTIGFGRTENVKLGDITTEASEDKWLRLRLARDEKEIRSYLKEHGYKNLKEYQIEALTSFTYNCGLGNFYKLTDNGNRTLKQIGEKINAYNKGGGKVLGGLVKRRAWETDLFFGRLEESEIKDPTAKDLQSLLNQITGSDLEIDGKIGKKTIKVAYDYIKKGVRNDG